MGCGTNQRMLKTRYVCKSQAPMELKLNPRSEPSQKSYWWRSINAMPLSQQQQNSQLYKKKQELQSSMLGRDNQSESENSEAQNKNRVPANSNQQITKIKYIKYYEAKPILTDFYIKNIKYLKYVLPSRTQEQKCLIFKSLLQQNQMNILRYLKEERLDFVAKIEIIEDLHPQKECLISYEATQFKACFLFTTQKCDKDYSMLSKGFGRNFILNKTFWSYKQPKTVYSFIKHFASCIQILQRYHIHQTDFNLQNFIKFGNIFFAIDFNQAFFVKANNKSEKYFQLNKKIFQHWLDLEESEELTCLTAANHKYQAIKQQYSKDKHLESAVSLCIEQMENHMIINHKNQFLQICHEIASLDALKQKGFPLKQKQIIAIRSVLPKQNDNQFRFSEFLTKLQYIYKQFHSQAFSLDIKNKFKQFETDLICRQLSLASSFLKDMTEIKDRVLTNIQFHQRIQGMIKLMHLKPLQNVCQYDQIWHSEDDILLSSLDNSHPLKLSIFSNSGYIVLFLKSFLKLTQELQDRGFLLLQAQIDWFVQYGERFILKNLAFLLKISPEFPQNQKEGQLIKYSYKAFFRFFDFNVNSKYKYFWNTLQKIAKDQLEQTYIQIRVSDNYLNHLNYLKNKNIANFFKKYSSYIHFDKFKKMASILFSRNQSDMTKYLKTLIDNKNEKNFYSLLQQISELKNQYY